MTWAYIYLVTVDAIMKGARRRSPLCRYRRLCSILHDDEYGDKETLSESASRKVPCLPHAAGLAPLYPRYFGPDETAMRRNGAGGGSPGACVLPKRFRGWIGVRMGSIVTVQMPCRQPGTLSPPGDSDSIKDCGRTVAKDPLVLV